MPGHIDIPRLAVLGCGELTFDPVPLDSDESSLPAEIAPLERSQLCSDAYSPTAALREDFGRAGLNLVLQGMKGDVPLRPSKDVVVLPFELEKHVL